MRPEPASDPLALWRGIDDAVWREATRVAAPPLRVAATAPAVRRPQPAPAKVAEPA